MNDPSLDAKILALLSDATPRKARVIARKLGVDRSVVNTALYGRLRPQVAVNDKHEWTSTEHRKSGNVSSEVSAAEIETPRPRFTIKHRVETTDNA